MHGFVLYRTADDGEIRRYESTRSSRKRLRGALDEGVPNTALVLGVVLLPDDDSHLHAVPLEADHPQGRLKAS